MRPTKTKRGNDKNNQANFFEALSEKNDLEDMSKEERKIFKKMASKTPQARAEGCGCLMWIVFLIIGLAFLYLFFYLIA